MSFTFLFATYREGRLNFWPQNSQLVELWHLQYRFSKISQKKWSNWVNIKEEIKAAQLLHIMGSTFRAQAATPGPAHVLGDVKWWTRTLRGLAEREKEGIINKEKRKIKNANTFRFSPITPSTLRLVDPSTEGSLQSLARRCVSSTFRRSANSRLWEGT